VHERVRPLATCAAERLPALEQQGHPLEVIESEQAHLVVEQRVRHEVRQPLVGQIPGELVDVVPELRDVAVHRLVEAEHHDVLVHVVLGENGRDFFAQDHVVVAGRQIEAPVEAVVVRRGDVRHPALAADVVELLGPGGALGALEEVQKPVRLRVRVTRVDMRIDPNQHRCAAFCPVCAAYMLAAGARDVYLNRVTGTGRCGASPVQTPFAREAMPACVRSEWPGKRQGRRPGRR